MEADGAEVALGEAPLDGGRQAGPYAAQSGSTPRGPSLEGRQASASREAVGQCPDERAPSTNGMSQATTTTGAGPRVTAV